MPTTSTSVGSCPPKLRDLEEAHPQQRIEQQRQHEDHEQRPPIAQLVADLAEQDQPDVAGRFIAGWRLSSCRENQLEEQFLQVALVVLAPAISSKRAFGEDLPAMDDRQAVAELLRLAHDVRGEEDALAVIAQLGHRLQQRPRDQHVQPRGGLVEDQHRRVVDDGPGDGDLLLHAGGHLRPQQVADVVHLQPLEERFHPHRQLVRRGCRSSRPKYSTISQAGHAVVDGRVGRHEADLAAHQGRLGDHVAAVDRRRAGGGPQHRAEDPQGGGLAGPVGAQQAVRSRPAGRGS